MVTAAERDAIRARLLTNARDDETVAAAATTGSYATGDEDAWSDVDLFLGVRGPVPETMQRWTERLYAELAAVHHWDLPSGPSVYRVFLLANGLEVDIAFTPEADFGPRGPQWRLEFGEAGEEQPAPAVDREAVIGRGWHHALHARASIERRRSWQAEYWIGALRDEVIALACLRLGLPHWYAKGAHLLPRDVTDGLDAALVRSLDEPELRRALDAAVGAFEAEVARADSALADRLRPVLDRAVGDA